MNTLAGGDLEDKSINKYKLQLIFDEHQAKFLPERALWFFPWEENGMRGREINLFRDISGMCACIAMCLMCSNTMMVTVKCFSEVENRELACGFRG